MNPSILEGVPEGRARAHPKPCPLPRPTPLGALVAPRVCVQGTRPSFVPPKSTPAAPEWHGKRGTETPLAPPPPPPTGQKGLP